MAIDTENSLTTLAEAKAWIGVKVADTEKDSIIEALIDSVSVQFNKLTNRLLKARDITGYYDGDNTTTFWTPEYPINTITSIHVDSERDYESDTEVTEYVFYGDEGRIESDEEAFSAYPQAVKIVYNAGFTTIPADIQVACKDQVKWLFRRWKKNNEGIQQTTTIDGTVENTVVGEILKTSHDIMMRYVKKDHR